MDNIDSNQEQRFTPATWYEGNRGAITITYGKRKLQYIFQRINQPNKTRSKRYKERTQDQLVTNTLPTQETD